MLENQFILFLFNYSQLSEYFQIIFVGLIFYNSFISFTSDFFLFFLLSSISKNLYEPMLKLFKLR